MFKDAVDARLLLLMKRISQIKSIRDKFYLAGGTALALQLGHRKSFDIDLFTKEDFDTEIFTQLILSINGKILRDQKGTIDAVIDGIKLSMLSYPYELIEEFHNIEQIKVADIRDIACMKVVAISQRAEKKDFFDIYEILNILPPNELKILFLKKYGSNRINCYHILKSFFYFDDAENSADPVSRRNISWDDVKKFFISNEKMLTDAFLS